MKYLLVMDSINSYLERTGLDDPFAKGLLVVFVMIGIAIMGSKYNATGSSLFIINGFIFIIAVLMGFLPTWSLLALIIVVVLYAVLILNSGSSGGGE